jgi:hypothetical protein
MAGLARAGDDPGCFDEALALWRTRGGHDFSAMWSCTPEVTRGELALAARALGRAEEPPPAG